MYGKPTLVLVGLVPVNLSSSEMSRLWKVSNIINVYIITHTRKVMCIILKIIHSYRVSNGTAPYYSLILHSCNFVSVWSLPEMSAVCHHVADITCGRAIRICFALPVAPQMLRFWNGARWLQFVMKWIVKTLVRIHTGAIPFKCDVFWLQISRCDILKRDMRPHTETNRSPALVWCPHCECVYRHVIYDWVIYPSSVTRVDYGFNWLDM